MIDNPYKILGVKPDTPIRNIRKVYLKLSMKYHPDKNNNSKECEEQFKKISHAYQKIIHPEKYRNINTTYHQKFNDKHFTKFTENIINKGKQFSEWFQNTNLNDIKENLFTEASNYKYFYDEVINKKNTKQNSRKTDDIVINVKLNISDIYNNVEKTLNIKRIRKCSTCLGIGFTLNGICPECKGDNYCEYVKEVKFKSCDKQVILKNEGNETEDLSPGDIILNILCKDSEYKIINNYDLLYYFESKKLISEINFLDNKKYKINILKTNDNTIYKIKDKGLLKKDNTRGDLFIHVLNNINYSDTNILE